MAEKDYYKTLGVDRKATKEEIKKSYKKQAMKYHPDRAPEEKKKEYEEKFKEINEAASILGDDKKRQQYDQFGASAFSGGGGGGTGFSGFDFSDVMSQFRAGGFGDGDDIFDQIFGGGGGRTSRARRGSDLLYEMEITLTEAYRGTKKILDLNKLEHCGTCQGKGALHFSSCTSCQGSGYVRRTHRTPFGIFQQTGPCSTCRGQGQAASDSCSNCGGEGLVRKRKKLEVTLPAGMDEGTRLRIPGEGEVGPQGGSSGDLYVQVRVAPHEIFRREGADIHLIVPLSFTQAVLGDEIEVPTLDGKALLKIPSGTQSETVFRMRGKGMPHSGGNGDQLVKVHILVPEKLSKKQTELIRQLQEEKPSKSFLKKILG